MGRGLRGLAVAGLVVVAVLAWRSREQDQQVRAVWTEVTDPVS